MILKKVFFLLIFSSFIASIYAQQNWGIEGSNYAGVSNVDLNPSGIVLSKCTWDFNIVSADASLLNNSFYMNPQFVFPSFFKPQITFATSNTSDQTKIKSADLVLRDKIQNSTFLNLSSTIKGPSFMFSNGNDAFALTTAFRAGMSTFNLPKSLVQLAYENLNLPALNNQPFNVSKGVDAAAMAWFEIGGTYAKKIAENSDFIFAGGASLKLNIGYSGGYALSNGVDYFIPYRANFTSTNLNLNYAHSINTETNPVSIKNPSGSGVSGDFGFTILKKKNKKPIPYYGCPDMSSGASYLRNVSKNYRWKLGFSLIDLGGISFSTNASQYTYTNVAASWDSVTRVNPKTLAQVDQLISNHFNGTQNATQNKNFFIWSPTAVSAQFDYNYNDLFYGNFSIIQRVVFTSQARLARMNSLALTPRYETYDIEIAVPFILNEYTYPNLGLMIRYKYFFIGSDQLGSTLGMTSLYGLNLYFGFKIKFTGRVGSDPKIVY